MKPLISVITVNRNNCSGLKGTIESVLNQSNKGFEYIIIDGCSSDSSVDVIHEYNEYIDYWISENDQGIYDAMNKGINKAKGDFIIFLNSGDYFANTNVLEECANYVNISPEVDIFYGDMIVVNSGLNTKYYYSHDSKLGLLFFKNDTINHQSSLIRSNIFSEFGYYPEKYKLASDFWLFLLSFLEDKVFMHLKLAITVYNFDGISAKDDFKLYKLEQLAIWKELVLSPKYINKYIDEVDGIVSESKRISEENNLLKEIARYKLVKVALRSTELLRFLRKKIFI